MTPRPGHGLNWVFGFGAILLIAILLAGPARAASTLTAKDILDRVDDLFRGDSSHGRMVMTVTTVNWKRSLTIEAWSEGKDKSLLRILAPTKEKGTATLRVDNDIWNYLPKVNRVIKLPSSMMGSSWMGSHFTNDDLVKESRMADDYTFEVTYEGERAGRKVIEITCIPKPEAVVVWGKLVVEVAAEDYMPFEMVYYDEDLNKARTMRFEDVGLLGGRRLPKTMVVTPADKPSESTVVTYMDMSFDLKLSLDLFTLRNLQQ